MTDTAAARSPMPRWRRWAFIVLGVFAILLAALWLALPRWVQGSGARLASEVLGRELRITDVQFEPWRLGLVLNGVTVAGAPGQPEAMLSVARLDADLSLRSLWHGSPVLSSLTVERPLLRLARLAPGKYDIDDVLARFAKPSPTPTPTAPPPALALYNIRLIDGELLLDDRPAGRKHQVDGLQLNLPFLSTLDTHVKVHMQPALSGRVNGVAFGSTAEALPFADRREATLHFNLAGLDLASYAAYLPEGLPVRLQKGLLDAKLALRFSQAPKLAAQLSLSGQLGLRGFALQTPAGAPWLGWQALNIALKDVQPLRRQVQLGAVEWIGLEAAVQRDASGAIWMPMQAATPAPSAAAPAWVLGFDSFKLSEAAVAWRDASVRPQVVLRVDGIQASLGALQWPLAAKALPLTYGLRLAAARLSGEGTLSPSQLALNWQWQGLALDALSPYVQAAVPLKVRGVLGGWGDIAIERPLDADAAARTALRLRELALKNFALTPLADEPAPLLTLSALGLDDVRVDLAARKASLGELSLSQPGLSLSRDRSGVLSTAALLPAPTDAPATDSSAPAWAVSLAGLTVERGSLAWRDAKAAAIGVSQIGLRVQNLAWPSTAAMPLRVSLKLGGLQAPPASLGHLQWQGQLALAPLAASGQLTTERLPLHLLDPYLDPAWSLHLQQAMLGLKGDFSAQQTAQGLQANLSGDLRLGDLRLLQARQIDGERVIGEELLNWQALDLSGLKFALAAGGAPQMDVAEARLNDFFARLIINEQGRFILRDLGPQEAANKAASDAAKPAGEPLKLSIKRTQLSKGNVDFTDRFIRPNYSARLSELEGTLGAFASGSAEMAPLTVRGRVAGTGHLEIDGQLNPSGGSQAMDIKAAATDIELAPLSPYAAKYAGYAIERGKFSTRVQYKIEPGGALQANNQIILNQLTFGDKVDSPDATSLPVLFAVALLTDRNGVIDVSLPVSGSTKDPEFSVSGLVFKLIRNLLGKALSAPFSLFTGSESGDLSQTVFPSGSAQLQAPEQLDKVAQMLDQRPALSLILTGHADASVEKLALQEAQLQVAVLRQGGDADAALKQVYAAAKLLAKPRNLLGLARDIPAAEMRALLLASYTVTDDGVRDLALQRSIVVRDALMARGVPNSRIFLAAPKLAGAGVPRVDLSLQAH